MDWNKFKIEMFPYLVMSVILMMGICWVVKDNLIFYQKETYESWEIQQEYSELLRNEIDFEKNKVADLNLALNVCEVILIYEKEKRVSKNE